MPLVALADEGMWLINAFQKNIYPQMKKQGLKLAPGEIYNENTPSISSAIVSIDGGTGTGSVISAQGLVITNHHVASGDIHALSTNEKNYIENGFWASNRSEEIPLKGKTISFLKKVVNVTAEAQAMHAEMKAKGQTGVFAMRKLKGTLEKEFKDKENSPYELSCVSFWGGELYLMFYYEVYTDVRLVGAPPVTIGAFGGEQDNWNWPQHKGDFALYRVYGDKDGKPAEYSKDNVPIKPVKVLNISTSGIQNGDYTMVLGFPGRTKRYVSSYYIEEKRTVANPVIVKARRDRLDVMKKYMEADPKVRLLYSDKYFSISNYADYAKWENICLRRYDAAGIRAAEEAQLQQWIDQSPERRARYGTLLEDLKKGYSARAEAERNYLVYQETWFRPNELMLVANRYAMLAARLEKNNKPSINSTDKEVAEIISNARSFLTKFDLAVDRETLIKMLEEFTANIPREMWGEPLRKVYDRFAGNAKAIVDEAYDGTICTDVEKMQRFFKDARTPQEMINDPLVALAYSVQTAVFKDGISAVNEKLGFDTDAKESEYARAIYEMRNDKGIAQYPDANSTMRITYGNVGPIAPYDGVQYGWRSTINGYTEKYNPEDYEFRVDDKMRSLIASQDWGRWGEKGQLYVNFLTNNDITGGNSGSPVLNGKGNVVGLAFDGNRESMSDTYYFHPEYAKTVCVDIRFVLWVMDKYAGAGALINEMNLVK